MERLRRRTLETAEVWTTNRAFFREQGYALDDSYEPGWAPESNAERQRVGESRLPRDLIAVAVRISDGADVVLKATRAGSWELAVATYVSDAGRASDRRSHCVPIYAVLDPPAHPQWRVIVMPLLRRFDDPPFDTVGEAIDCLRQIIEGVQYLHRHRIAHRDIGVGNIVMEGGRMYPDGFCPRLQGLTKDLSRTVAPSATRAMVWPRYYLIDFGFSRIYEPSANPVELNEVGTDRTVPELRTGRLTCNPFPVDVYCLGNLIRQRFLLEVGTLDRPKRVGLECLRPLADAMTAEEPSERPTMDDVALAFHELTRRLKRRHLRGVCEVDRWDDVLWRPRHLVRRVVFTLQRRSPLPAADPPEAVLDPALGDFYTAGPVDAPAADG